MSEADHVLGSPVPSPELNAALQEVHRIGFEIGLALTDDYDEAKDLAQIAQTAVWEMSAPGGPGFDISQPLQPLVFTIVTRHVSNSKRAEVDRALPLIKYGYGLEDHALVQFDSALHAEATELGEAASETLRAMPEVRREIWLAAHHRQLTHKQIAAERGISVNTVHAQLHLAAIAFQKTKKRFIGGGR